MLRYFAASWCPNDKAAEQVALSFYDRLRAVDQSWVTVIHQAGFIAVYSDPLSASTNVHLLAGGTGVIFGSLFVHPDQAGANPMSEPQTLGQFQTERIISSNGKSLIDTHWGSYVALIHNKTESTLWALKSPCGFLACFSVDYMNVRLLFSRTEDCVHLKLIRFTVNWDRVVAHVVDRVFVNSRSAIDQISEVPAGECWKISTEHQRADRYVYWDPYTIARSTSIDELTEAALSLRRITKTCIHALASSHNTITNTLSGGVDSSIVLGCLQDAPSHPRVVCVTFFSQGSDSDEREYARMAAARAGCMHVEQYRDRQFKIKNMLGARHTAIPSMYILEAMAVEPTKAIARAQGATAATTGVGGDANFLHAPATYAAGDFLQKHGLKRQFFSTALDVARIEGNTIWKVIVDSVRQASGNSARTFAQLRTEYSSAALGKNIIKIEHIRWRAQDDSEFDASISMMRGIPQGKLGHIYQTIISSYEDPLSRPDDPEQIHPLASQPITELCLRTPTWVHVRKGWTRAVARQAFVSDVPRPILERTSKGGMEDHLKLLSQRNINDFREIMLDGTLVKEGVLNREYVARALSGKPTNDDAGPNQLFLFLGVEIWLNIWRNLDIRTEANLLTRAS